MSSLAIIGAQWGDEGKGKITDLLGQKADVVVRFQGGNNAGHTIIFDDKKIVLHQAPSGILHKNCVSVIAHGVVFEPEAFLKELEEVKQHVQVSPDRLKIALNASVITSYHKLLDSIRENKSSTKIGTTGKGIGPAYEDKVSRRGLKIKDLLDKDILRKRLAVSLEEKAPLFENYYQVSAPSLQEETDRLYEFGKALRPYVCDSFSFLEKCRSQGKKILFEGAQGILLDIDYGSYPYVTSSSTGAGGIFTGASGSEVEERLGICKAYTTRVGEGPMPTEITEAIGDEIQKIGNEFGATTGRRRRCGWLDLPGLKYAVKASGLTSLALTKLDVLSGLDQLKVCIAYEIEGSKHSCAYPGLDLSKAKPVYKSLSPFTEEFKNEGSYSKELEDYIEFIEKNTGVPIGIVAYGPERKQIHFRKEYFL